MAENIFVEEYTLLESVHIFAGFLDIFALLYPQIQDIDLRTQAPSLAVPVYLAQGAHEAPGRAGPAREWFDGLQAPTRSSSSSTAPGTGPCGSSPTSSPSFMTQTVLNRDDPLDQRPTPSAATSEEDEMHTLEIQQVTKRYGHDVVVDDLSFTVRPGTRHGIPGTQWCRQVDDHEDPAGSRLGRPGPRIHRRNPLPRPGRPRPDGRRGPRAQRVPSRSQRTQPSAGPRGRRRHPRRRASTSCSTWWGWRTPRDRRVGAYSLGMRQRLGLAAALLGDPPVLVLDEPGNGLDPQGIRWLRDLLRERAAAGDTVFVSSHLLDEVEHLADDLVVINHGRLVTTGELATLQQAGTTVRTPEPERLARLLTDAGALVHPDSEGELVVRAIEISRIGDRPAPRASPCTS